MKFYSILVTSILLNLSIIWKLSLLTLTTWVHSSLLFSQFLLSLLLNINDSTAHVRSFFFCLDAKWKSTRNERVDAYILNVFHYTILLIGKRKKVSQPKPENWRVEKRLKRQHKKLGIWYIILSFREIHDTPYTPISSTFLHS